MTDLAHLILQRIEALGRISDEPARLTRTFCSPAMQRANNLVGSWMREAGMIVRKDAIANLIGRYSSKSPKSKVQNLKSKILLLGSHLDTVRDAGKFDGALGVITAIACVQRLQESQIRLPFEIQIIAFADEEGVRYHQPYLGSKALAGTFDAHDLKRQDSEGISMERAIRNFGGKPEALATARLDPNQLLGYAEVHIEQGPVLEENKLALGVVTAIAGQTRAQVTFTGRAGHAGTTPMRLRRDALSGAAEFILAVETVGRSHRNLVATVGELITRPGASNVIPSQVRLSLDLRHPEDALRRSASTDLQKRARTIASKRKLHLNWQRVSEMPAVKCDRRLSALVNRSVKRHQKRLILLPSGAGHDAAVMAAVTPITMLFVRCKGGISHHPDELVSEADIRLAIAVMIDFIQSLARDA
jgi:allantoate deiminase